MCQIDIDLMLNFIIQSVKFVCKVNDKENGEILIITVLVFVCCNVSIIMYQC